ncbi:beta-1,3-galactosyltransferase 2-like isoform X1 [Lates japonicus]|uniref:Beta-1,3-galactosyltransferase 2-like isoform X1 n=1 Tax=Lates japonicus TaxID=270547 RepID=A0AAD3N0N9_LATJO|nr:beta-1,3-galactosyltransferase 2-like isoform X1 [Lates japonicus]
MASTEPIVRVRVLGRRPFLLTAGGFRRVLKAEVGLLLSMLFASPLKSRRFLRLFSAQITASHQSSGFGTLWTLSLLSDP